MKKLSLLLCMVCVSYFVQAQIVSPQPSPSATLIQKVGLTDVTVEYSRPSMKGRTIFGDLVPTDKLWRTGANANTKVTFSDDVVVDGQTLKAGSYAIFATPGKASWDVAFYTDTSNWGMPRKWDDTKIAAKTSVQVYPMPVNIETFTISLDDLTDSSAVIGILWEKTYVGIKFTVPTDATVMSSIDKVMNGADSGDYFTAAIYYLNAGKDINKAKEWIDKSFSMNKKDPAFWQLRQQSLIYAKAGDKKEAIKIAKKSLAASIEANNQDYVKMNKASIQEWGGK
ncbi:MAG: DUF2911 domain-containing protein [Cellulophaga sp.]